MRLSFCFDLPTRAGLICAFVAQASELASIHALGWDARIELVGAPDDVDPFTDTGGEGLIQPTLADKAPGADQVGEDLQVHVQASSSRKSGSSSAHV